MNKKLTIIFNFTFLIFNCLYADTWTQDKKAEFEAGTVSNIVLAPDDCLAIQRNGTTWTDRQVAFTESNAYYPFVMYDNEAKIYKMWYRASNSNIAYRTSTDGTTWSASSIVLARTAGTFDSNGIIPGTVIKDTETATYKMWYSGANSAKKWTIGYATSTNGTTWGKYSGNPVVSTGVAGSYDSSHAYLCSVIKQGGTYKMWYGMHNGRVRLGYATSPDGITWTKQGMVMNLGVYPSFDYIHTGYAPTVRYDDGKYELWYTGYGIDGGVNSRWRIGYANSTDGITWESRQLVLNFDLATSTHVLSPAVISDKTDGKYMMWYAENTTQGWVRIARVTNNVCTATAGNFTSSTKDIGTGFTWSNISWTPAVLPAGTTLQFQFATNDDNSTWNFIGPGGSASAYYTNSAGETLYSGHTGHRYAKYKAYFLTENTNYSPSLSTITVTMSGTPPEDIDDLSVTTIVSSPLPGKVKLSWTAPGDDGNQGTATLYSIKYATYSIATPSDFTNATLYKERAPVGVAGSAEDEIVTGLTPGTSYYFSIRTRDEIPYWSGVSNSPSCSAPAFPSIIINNPDAGNVMSSTYNITWAYTDSNGQNSHRFYIYISSDSGTTWQTEDETGLTQNTTWYPINTKKYTNGTSCYKVKVKCIDSDNLSQEALSNGLSSISNNNEAPVVTISQPNGGESWGGYPDIKWSVNDPNVQDTHSFQIWLSSESGDMSPDSYRIAISTNWGITCSSYVWTWSVVSGISYPVEGQSEWYPLESTNTCKIRVVAKDTGSPVQTSSDTSNADFSINIDNQAPNSFSLLSPANYSEFYTNPPTFNWQISTDQPGDTVTYTVELSTISASDFSVKTSSPGNVTNSYTPSSQLSSITKYYWRVIATDGSRTKNSTETFEFTIDNTAPTNIANLSTSYGAKQGYVNLTWTSPADDAGLTNNNTGGKYSIRYSTNSVAVVGIWWNQATEFGQSWTPSAAGSSQTETITGLAANTTYYFVFKTTDSLGNVSDFSNTATGNTITPPSVTIIKPNGGESISGANYLLSFSTSDLNSQDTHTYEISISLNSDYSEGSYRVIGTTTGATTYSFSTFNYQNGSYKIRVKATDEGGLTATDYSDNPFTINNANNPPTVTVISPNDGSWSSTTTVTWIYSDPNASDVHTFSVYYSSDAGNNYTQIVDELSEGTTYYEWLTTTVANGGQYKIKVEATDTGGLSGYDISDSTFEVSNLNEPPNAFNLISPPTNSQINMLTPLFSWENKGDQNVGQTLTYTLSISKNSDVSSPVFEKTGINDTSYGLTSGEKLDDNTTYYWKVTARDDDFKTPKTSSTTIWSFYITDALLAIKSVNPENESRKNWEDVLIIAANFNKRVDTATLNTSNITIADKYENPVTSLTLNYNDYSYGLSITPATPLEENQNYTVSVSSNIKDITGNVLTGGYQWSFIILANPIKELTVKSKDENNAIVFSSNTLPRSAYIKTDTLTTATSTKLLAATKDTYSNPLLKPISQDGYEITCTDGENQPLTTLAKDYTLSIKYADVDNDGYVDGTLTQEKYLRVFCLNETKNMWELVEGSTVDFRNNVCSARLNHFSTFALLAYKAPEKDLSGVTNFPNPFNPNDSDNPEANGIKGTVIRYILTEDSDVTIRIYNLVGDLVKKMEFAKGDEGGKGTSVGYSNKIAWDGRNDDGMLVANGAYICQIIAKNTKGTFKETRKIAVLK